MARFDREVSEMSLRECQCLLEQILHQADTGEKNAEVVFRALETGEKWWRWHEEGVDVARRPEAGGPAEIGTNCAARKETR